MAEDRLQALYGGFKRLRDFPLDPSCIFDTLAEMEEYIAEKSTAYAGQVLVALQGEGRGIYYVIRKEPGLDYIKVLDYEDSKELFDRCEALHESIQEIERNIGATISDFDERLTSNYEEIDRRIEALVGIDTDVVENAIDTLNEVYLVLNNINNAIYESPAFKKLLNYIEKLEKIIPIDLQEPISSENFHPSQTLVASGELDAVKDYVNHSEKVSVFEFGSGKNNYSEILGRNNNGFTITQVKVAIERIPEGEYSVRNFNIRIAYSNVILVSENEIDFSDTSTFIYEMNRTASQDTRVTCADSIFDGVSGRIYIKYYE